MSPRPLLAWASDHFSFPLPGAHPFPLVKYTRVREALLADGVLHPEWVTASDPAPREWLVQAHDADYVDRTLVGEWTAAEVRRLGLPWSAEPVVKLGANRTRDARVVARCARR